MGVDVKRVVGHPVVGLLVVGLGVAVAESVGDVVWGVVATVGGYLIGLLAMQVGMLVGALVLGVSVRSVVVGVGPRVGEWGRAGRVVVVRSVPVFLSVSIAPGKAPVRPRMWGAAVCSAVAGVAVVVWLAGVWVVLGVASGLTVGYALIPRKTAAATSTGWFLVHLLRLGPEQAAQFEAAPVVKRTVDAAISGDLDTADRLAQQLAADHPELKTARAARVLVHQARGRYVEALALAMAMIDDQNPDDAPRFFAALAGLACDTVEAGLLDPAVGLPTAANALDAAETLGYPAYKLTGTKAQHALLTGDTAQAITLARRAVETNDDPLSRADDLITLARAHMAAHDNRSARAAVAEAEQIAAWWPRVQRTRARLDVT
ncbi:tetratricopeptide repeat protein [Actinokineospora sp. NPDC004072]